MAKTVPARIHFAPDVPSPRGGWGPHGGSKDLVTPGDLAAYGDAMMGAIRQFAEQSLPDWIEQKLAEVDGEIAQAKEDMLARLEGQAPILYTPPPTSADNGIISHAAPTGTTLQSSTGKYFKGPRINASGHISAPEAGDFGDLPTSHYHLATAQADYDVSSPDAPTVLASIDGVVGNKTVSLLFRGTYAKSIEYPNVRSGQQFMAFQDSAGNWYAECNDAPINGPGNIKWTLIDASISANIPAGWKLLAAGDVGGTDPLGRVPVIGDGAVLGENGGDLNHKHGLNAHNHGVVKDQEVQSGTGATVNAVDQTNDTSMGYTHDSNGMDDWPSWMKFAILKRIL